jgi:hypothetical protein
MADSGGRPQRDDDPIFERAAGDAILVSDTRSDLMSDLTLKNRRRSASVARVGSWSTGQGLDRTGGAVIGIAVALDAWWTTRSGV